MRKIVKLSLVALVMLMLVSGANTATTLAQDDSQDTSQTDSTLYLPMVDDGPPVVTLPGPIEPGDPKPATDATKAVNATYLADLPFSDTQSFTDAQQSLIATIPITLLFIFLQRFFLAQNLSGALKG